MSKVKSAHGRKLNSLLIGGNDVWTGGAYRDRTVFFKELREKARSYASFSSLSSSPPIPHGGSEREVEMHALVGSSASSSAIMNGSLAELRINVPPKWLRLVDESHYDIERIKTKVKELDQMHKKHLLPGFDDREAEEMAIQMLTSEITQTMQKCQQRVVKLGQLKNGISDEQLLLKQNMRLSLAGQLQDLSASLRHSQKSYLEKLKARRARNPVGREGGTTYSGAEVYGDDGQGGMELIPDTGFSHSQLRQVAIIEDEVNQRSRDITAVQSSIEQLADLFKDLAVLLVEQGTILDRIDYNIESTRDNVERSINELEQAEQYQKKTGFKMCMVFLLIIIIGLTIALAFKLVLPIL